MIETEIEYRAVCPVCGCEFTFAFTENTVESWFECPLPHCAGELQATFDDDGDHVFRRITLDDLVNDRPISETPMYRV